CIHPQFSKNKYIYLSYNYRKENDAVLKISRYQFLNDTLINPITILDNINASPNHTGCRLRFGPDEKLYITTGDADRPILSQDLKSLNGKILRVNEDGSIPADNPFVNNDTARKEIWTYGHRNTQGIDFDPATGQLYNSEHGPTGGDEINVIIKGNNYGWPIIHHQDSREGMRSPLLEYSPSIGPSQVAFYNADAFPLLKKKLLVACLRGEKIMQLTLAGNKIIAEENVLEKGYGRIRALTVGPDGYIYFSTSQNDPPEGTPSPGYDMVIRLRPSTKNNYQEKNEKREQAGEKGMSRKQNPTMTTYMQLCASCHGVDLKGTERAKSMMDDQWEYGSTKKDIIKSIREGIIEKGMPAWEGTLTKGEIEKQADFILIRAKKK
ncbi:MAG TPA: PQQ-dependent sugar dehydrogenase, partial [Chitinophagaceae bacterium]|nr:PQQ-dependent sugar dehydrogenase [Chitinophagaceae bacterium]